MELKEFIHQSISEIVEGVAAAAKEYPLAVAPGHIEGKPVLTERLVTFEVNVVTDLSAKSGLKVMSFAELGGETSRSKANRVSFSVPIHMNVALEGKS